MSMNYDWVIQHKNGKVTKKHDDKGLNPYHTRDKTTKRDNVQTFALQDEQGKTIVLVNVPDGAEVFQRHRVTPINYFNRFHDMPETVPEHVENGRYVPAKTLSKSYPEITYDDVWMIGYRKREADGSVTVYFKVVYSDGKIEEHNGWNERSWLFEPEWFSEEQV